MKHTLYRPIPSRFMRRIKDYGLPIAILIGILFYRWLSPLSVAIPYMIVCMLFFTFLKLRPRDLHFLPESAPALRLRKDNTSTQCSPTLGGRSAVPKEEEVKCSTLAPLSN